MSLTLLLVVLTGCPANQPAADSPVRAQRDAVDTVDPDRMSPLDLRRNLVQNTITPLEDRTEALGRNLDKVARFLRLGDSQSARAFFPDTVECLLPQSPVQASRSLRLGISEGTWSAPEGAQTTRLPAKSVVAHLNALADSTASLDEFRIQVVSADPGAEDALTGILKIRVLGSRSDGGLEWLRARVRYRAIPETPLGDFWKLHTWRVEHVQRMRSTRPLFSEVSREAGVRSTASNPGEERMGQRFEGAAVGDVNGDQRLDLVTVSPQGAHLYIQTPEGTFIDEAESAGILHPVKTQTSGVPLLVDYDNDGDPDLFVAGTGPFALFENETLPGGPPQFVDRTRASGIDVSGWTYSAAAGDVNGDGLLDLYATSYHDWPWVLPDSWAQATNGTNNRLLVQGPGGTFRDQAAEWGVQGGRWSFSAQFGDVDGDADLDLFVANDYGSGSTLYRNTGTRFEDVGRQTGAWDRSGGMGVSLGDPDNDGDLDIHVTNMSSSAAQRIFGRLSAEELADTPYFQNLAAGNALFINAGDGTWKNEAKSRGPLNAGWAWGGGFVDLDNDGWEDVHAPNGFMSGQTEHDT